jgi:uncharacterized membrane protein YhaH (DUF805 family)
MAMIEPLDSSNFFSRITTFRGRINRMQYFYGLLLKLGLFLVAGMLVIFTDLNGIKSDSALIVTLPLCLFVIWVNLSLQVRRLHDIGQSGFWLLLYLVPFLNYIFAIVIYIVCLAAEGEKKPNKYGDAPYRIF